MGTSAVTPYELEQLIVLLHLKEHNIHGHVAVWTGGVFLVLDEGDETG